MGVVFTPYASVRRFPSLSQCCQRTQSRIALQRQTTTILSKTRETIHQVMSLLQFYSMFMEHKSKFPKDREDTGGLRIRTTELLR